MAKPVVILFAKAPRLGTVKKRLARSIGEMPALRFYRNTLAATLRKLGRLDGFETIIAITPDRAWLRHPPGWAVAGQGAGDLGVRMARAFQKFPRRRVILVGADIPDLAAAEIRAAAKALLACDAVFGPAADGGYYLVAMGARRPVAPFAKARWSTEHALADTAKNFAHLRVTKLRVLRDVDTADDLML
jgi:rSAM/selenodomain-associated transferase 1